MRWRALIAAAALGGVFPAASAVSHHEPDHFYDCEPAGPPQDLLKTKRVLVYFESGRADRSEFVGCHRPSRKQHLLADAADYRMMFASPAAVSARRSAVGYAVRDNGRTVVEVRDLASEPGPWPCVGCGVEQPAPLRRIPATHHPRRKVGVATLVLGRATAVVWTTCRLGGRSYDYALSHYDGCRQTFGATVRVWRARTGHENIELLDKGRNIHVRSLRIERGRVHWRTGETRRSAEL